MLGLQPRNKGFQRNRKKMTDEYKIYRWKYFYLNIFLKNNTNFKKDE